jgi:negative regulator of flagellin synthesis FlgM
MKIDNSNSNLPTSSASETTVRTNTVKLNNGPTNAMLQEGVNVTLGSTSSQLRSIESNFANTPMVDAKKVAEIKQAISEGRFQINSSAIADSLLNNVEDLLSAEASD